MIFAPPSRRTFGVTDPTPEDIAANWKTIRARVDEAARRANRDPKSVRVVAVTKTKPAWMVEAARGAGATVFGENYVQEALAKQGEVSPKGPTFAWHLIGALQTNKAKQVVGKFDLIHAVDSEKLARELDRRAATANLEQVDVLIEVNLGEEASKSGVHPAAVEALLGAMSDLTRVRPTGLMAMPPLADGAANRPHFATLRTLSEALIARGLLPKKGCELSMGTTSDFEAAVEEGATLVRIGTAIFGPRAKRED